MAFPYIFEENFEGGGIGGFDSETDTGGQLDVAHYSELARFPWPGAAPFQGAYCLRAQLTGGTADAYLVEGDVNAIADATLWTRFALWLSPDFAATADDTFNLVEFMASSTVEAAVGLRITASTDVVEIGIGETAPTSFSSQILEKGVWYTVEIHMEVDAGAGNDGSIDIYLTKDGDPTSGDVVAATQVGSLDQGAITDMRIGVQDHLATTTGTILFDAIVVDDARVYPILHRYSLQSREIVNSGHIFVGPGRVHDLIVIDNGSGDCTLSLHDTDNANTDDISSTLSRVAATTASDRVADDQSMPYQISRGAYVVLGGTSPRAIVSFEAQNWSDAAVRRYGLRRPPQ